MKILTTLAIIIVLIVCCSLLVFIAYKKGLIAEVPKEECKDCDYFDPILLHGYCQHWEEKRRCDNCACNCFKKRY